MVYLVGCVIFKIRAKPLGNEDVYIIKIIQIVPWIFLVGLAA